METANKIVLYENDLARLDEVKKFIELNIHTHIDVKILSKKFTISTRTLQRHFCTCYGEHVSHYIHKSRMLKAMELLTAHSMSISQIGLTVGYNHRSAFTHAFTKFFGNPPAYFLRNIPANGDLARSSTHLA